MNGQVAAFEEAAAAMAITLEVPVERLVWAAYPTLDSLLLALLLGGILAGRGRGAGALFLGGGVACWLASDFAFTVLEGSSTGWMNAGWMLGAALMAAAAWAPPLHVDLEDRSEVNNRVGYSRLAVLALALLSPATVDVVAYFQGGELNPFWLLAATTALLSVGLVQGVTLMRSEVGPVRTCGNTSATCRLWRITPQTRRCCWTPTGVS